MSKSDEAELLKRAQQGDREAFGQLVRTHQRRVYACAVQMLTSSSAAEDATQETFIRAYRAIGRFDGRSKLSTWLHRICVNVCLNAIRSGKRKQASDIDDPRTAEPVADPNHHGIDPERAAEEAQLRARLIRALDDLSDSLRTTVVLVLIQGVSHQEAAEVLGCPEGTIAWRIHEARRRLRSALFEESSERPSGVGQGGAS
jgi:RNA polymerase sigma-70 factor (ECF subfamily)